MELLRRFKTTAIALVFSAFFYFASVLAEVDIFERVGETLSGFEIYEADKLLIAVLFVLCGFIIDMHMIKSREEREMAIQEHRLRVLRATMNSVNDINNNFLNSLLLFRMEAEDKGALSYDSLALFDSLISDASEKLKRISRLEHTHEKDSGGGIYMLDINAGSQLSSLAEGKRGEAEKDSQTLSHR